MDVTIYKIVEECSHLKKQKEKVREMRCDSKNARENKTHNHESTAGNKQQNTRFNVVRSPTATYIHTSNY